MDIVRLSIPYSFLHDRCRPTWRSIRFGLENELLDPRAAVEFAVDGVAETDTPSPDLLDLAGSSKSDPIAELVGRLAAAEPEFPEAKLYDEWLYLVLAWLYEHRNEYTDPLQRVEEVYADFGYPERVAGFVRYMPMGGPDLGSREANERRLFDKWQEYLEDVDRSPRTPV